MGHKEEKDSPCPQGAHSLGERNDKCTELHTEQCCDHLREVPGLLGRVQERLHEAGVLELSFGGWIGLQSGGVSPGRQQRRQQGGVKRHLKEELEKSH